MERFRLCFSKQIRDICFQVVGYPQEGLAVLGVIFVLIIVLRLPSTVFKLLISKPYALAW